MTIIVNFIMPEIKRKDIEFRTPWFDLIKKTVSGMPGTQKDEEYFSILPGDYVCILAFDKNNKIPLVRQYRPAIEAYSLELPAGHVDPDETPEDSIKRELLEETGYKALEIELLGILAPDTGRKSNRLWCYFSTNIEEHPADKKDGEGIDTILCSLQEVKALINKGEFCHALNVAVFTLAELKGKVSFNT